MKINKFFWKDKIILITGHNGFVGTWLTQTLLYLNVKKIYGYSKKNKNSKFFFDLLKLNKKKVNSFTGDINNLSKLKKVFKIAKPDIVIHLAAQPIVNVGYKNPIDTFKTNIIGTANLLNCVKLDEKIKAVLIVTSDKVYINKESNYGYKENDTLGGHDPYSASKAAAELITESMKLSYFRNKKYQKQTAIATARAGNIIGGGDWSEDRLIPDIINSIFRNKNIVIRSPSSVRPWQHVFDAINGYLLLIEKIFKYPNQFSQAWNFGPNKNNIRVDEIVKKSIKISKSQSKLIINKKNKNHETNKLNLNSKKAKRDLNWESKININDSLKLTIEWYECFFKNKKIKEISLNQIKKYF